MGYEHIEITQEGHVATLWLNRPDKRNALSEDLSADIPAAMSDLDDDDSVRVIVLAGRGPAFTVGIDIDMLMGLQSTGESQAAANLALYEKVRELQGTISSFANSAYSTN